jgi:hypothetical protein
MVFCESGFLIFDRYRTSSGNYDDDDERLTFGAFIFGFGLVAACARNLRIFVALATRLGQSIPGLGKPICRLCVPESRHRQTRRKRKSLIKRFKTPTSHKSSIADFFHLLHLL